MSEKKEKESPNAELDKAIKTLMKKLDGKDSVPPETAVKILNTAISWEKVKAGMLARDSDFDPDEL